MAMPSLQSEGGFGHQGKLAKSRKSIVVKPILKKLHVHSHSARTSLDLDRGWDEQPKEGNSPDLDYGYSDYAAGRDSDAFAPSERRHLFSPTTFHAPAEPAPATSGKASSKPSRDVSFTFSSADLAGTGPGVLRRANTFSATSHAHVRSTSGASAANAPSVAGRNGSTFVHPFQQIPRTSTPPLSYANSVASLDTTLVSQQREHNSIAEDEGDEELQQQLQHQRQLLHAAGGGASIHHHHHHQHRTSLPYPPTRKLSAPLLTSGAILPRRPSMTSSHRTSSQSDGNSVRVPMTRSNSVTPVLRPTQPALNHSRSDLEQQQQQHHHHHHQHDHQHDQQVTPGICSHDPFFTTTTATTTATTTPATNTATTTPLTISCSKTVSPTVSNTSPLSPFRTSMDLNGFRIRSRSDVDTHARQEQVREARRKFEAKQKEKDEKYAREQVRKRERADAKEALKFERQQAQRRKSSLGHCSVVSNHRASTSFREKVAGCFAPCDDDDEDDRTDDGIFNINSRSKSAKRRTTSVWTAFVLWLRTRFIKLGRRKTKSN
ncbi:hypothetical protein ESCO_000523 [Escovopsis weberi]|uniref:Uncharacterized protein n=1 Tax=Escovopsis weberi TaxID=150374 RepID=A0A0M9VTS6_ESCWE|nr:hypothetical protein ESCO_000523 [Escovopsis weberi]